MSDYSELLIESMPEIDLKQIGWKSPIQIFQDEMNRKIIVDQENNVMKAVCEQSIVVDKEELLKALAYDREQFEKGFFAGFDTGAESMSRRIVNRLGVLLDLVRTDQQLAVLQAIDIVKEEGGLNE